MCQVCIDIEISIYLKKYLRVCQNIKNRLREVGEKNSQGNSFFDHGELRGFLSVISWQIYKSSGQYFRSTVNKNILLCISLRE